MSVSDFYPHTDWWKKITREFKSRAAQCAHERITLECKTLLLQENWLYGSNRFTGKENGKTHLCGLDHGTPLRLHPLVLQKRILEVTWPLFCTGDRNSALMSLVVSKGGGHGETRWCLVLFRLEQQPLTSTSAAATSVIWISTKC